jgi:hypothetical protein
MYRKMNEKTLKQRNLILRTMAKARAEDGLEFLWLRELTRRTGLNMGTVGWVLHRYLSPDYIEFPEVDALIQHGLKIRPIKLKDKIYEQMIGKATKKEGKSEVKAE